MSHQKLIVMVLNLICTLLIYQCHKKRRINNETTKKTHPLESVEKRYQQGLTTQLPSPLFQLSYQPPIKWKGCIDWR